MRDVDKHPPNRLAQETSPYLLQHAHNPVDWYPWCDEAFVRARDENKPVFLSIGYSACHWCHVMERESFERDAVAEVLNNSFISIKVDREERPDLDEIYMTAVQMLTGGGGWPMTVFLTPDKQPFFGGTYFPPEDRYGRVGFKSLLERIRQLWTEKRADIEKSAMEVTRAISGHVAGTPAGRGGLDRGIIRKAVDQLEQSFDAQWGGFGEAPKFPPSAAMHVLMREYARTDAEPLRIMLRQTLDQMARGGLYDQVGGGFHRYSVDERWLVPHFEKMLYDNALLTMVYTDAWRLFRDPLYRDTASDTLDYVLRDMTDPSGAFYASEDADSEGEEGIFYVWRVQELVDVLGEEDGRLAAAFWGATDQGNFEGANILHVPVPCESFASQHGLDVTVFKSRIRSWKECLLTVRADRVRPARDDKVIAAWNGLMISAFARAGFAFNESRFLGAAQRAARFVQEQMVVDGVLHRTWRMGVAKHPAYLDDVAFLMQGLLDLYEADGDTDWLDAARAWADYQQREFGDTENGGFFYTSARLHRDVLVRSRPSYDGAEPSGNSIAALALLRLGALTDDDALREAGRAVLMAYAGTMERAPRGMLNMLEALDFYLGPVREVVIAGERVDAEWHAMVQVAAETYLPNRLIAYTDGGPRQSENALLKGKRTADGKPAAYVCEDGVCHAPVTSVEDLRRELKGGAVTP